MVERMMRIALRQPGFTLFEMLLATGLLALVATYALVDHGATADARLDLAAQRVALALRSARTEAVRTETFLRFEGSTSGQMTVHELDAQATPPQLVQLSRDPVSRQQMDFN
ncbi:MAG: GspH/FimT family pseudopilin, partial [Pseudomonadales bacterium]